MTGPLNSLKVLDFSTLLPGPFGTLILADMGADVLRIESPTRPDFVRLLPPSVNGVSAAHAYLNRSKRAMALDLKQPEGIEIVHRLVRDYDIVVEQFRPGVMDKLGLGYEALKAINPGLIYCSITGYGQTGPYRDRAGHDLNYLSIAGMTGYNGRRDSGPAPMACQVADVAGGSCHAVMAILAAVIHRQQTGEGQYLDISMTDAAFSLHALTAPGALVAGEDPELEGTKLNGGSFYDCYRTSDGRYLSVAGLEPQFFSRFCEAIQRPDLTAKGLSFSPQVVDEVKGAIAEAIGAHPLEHWLRVFAEVDCCVEPVLSFSEAREHPQLKARNMVVSVPDGRGGEQPQVASPFRFSATPVSYRFAGVGLGQHNEDVLREQGFTDEDIVRLREAGALG
ncbi:CaiB/BaiF CoA transferase family protein [Alloalcanivorax xenomutans]|uniref:CoA transferase n=1 Tax=Alloalcanivorax xenomutans TaxID=1094342 RepID=A0A9Q3W8D0_9GAMM|nr:CaiB/BaiF CoA-transferase family protein [Alloalcanivorax xenomutans]MCE7510202.1 CoA transferase [Alloalcanivorax xenomutans]PHS60848.1 MAG: carnitine dehydratase [Alcanivorax sp.]SOB98005.1 crotonobetainyl-CoA:carnitine CoA-transferase CaiB-like acyl-CoA transferase [Alloalcanivorax xenomutans]